MNREKFVLRWGLLTSHEINEFLINHPRKDNIYVDLIDVELEELEWKLFGSKISNLRIV